MRAVSPTDRLSDARRARRDARQSPCDSGALGALLALRLCRPRGSHEHARKHGHPHRGTAAVHVSPFHAQSIVAFEKHGESVW